MSGIRWLFAPFAATYPRGFWILLWTSVTLNALAGLMRFAEWVAS